MTRQQAIALVLAMWGGSCFNDFHHTLSLWNWLAGGVFLVVAIWILEGKFK